MQNHTPIDDIQKIYILPASPTRGNSISHQSPKFVMESVANELLVEKNNFPAAITIALEKVASDLHIDSYVWLAQQINQMPELNYLGMPGTKPHLQDLMTPELIKEWLSCKGFSGSIFLEEQFGKLGPKILDHIIKATIVALHNYAEANIGSGSFIRWNYSPLKDINLKRPPAIGLGHELIHAFYNAKGVQPGHQELDFSTVLYEYINVGLGPWHGLSFSENGLRKEWVDILPAIPKEDELNDRPVAQRELYDEAEETISNANQLIAKPR